LSSSTCLLAQRRDWPRHGTYPSTVARSVRWRLTAWPVREAGSQSVANLPTLQLEDPLRRVLVEPRQVRHGPVAKRRRFLDQCFGRFGKTRLNLGCRLDWSVIHGVARHLEPTARFQIETVIPPACSSCRIGSITCRPRPAGTAINKMVRPAPGRAHVVFAVRNGRVPMRIQPAPARSCAWLSIV